MSASLVAFAREAAALVGVPWHHQGRNPTAGLDCGGVLVVAARAAGYVVDDCLPYQRHPEEGRFLRHVRDHCDEIEAHPFGSLPLGALLVFRLAKRPQHVGVIVEAGEPPTFVHAYYTPRKVVRNQLVGPWPRRVVGAFVLRTGGVG